MGRRVRVFAAVSLCSWPGASVRQQMLICLSFPTKPRSLFTGLAFRSREDNTRATEKMQSFTFLQPSTNGEKAAIASEGLWWRETRKKTRHNSQKADKDQARTGKTKQAKRLGDGERSAAEPNHLRRHICHRFHRRRELFKHD